MPVKVNHRQSIYKGRVFDLVRENVTLENGVTTDVEIIRHPGAAAIVALTQNAEVILINQYRHALGTAIWEIPAGTLAPGESRLDCAKRELTEETGYFAETWQDLGQMIPVPGYSDERIHFYLAQNLSCPGERSLDADELIDVFVINFNQAMEMIERKEIQDGKTISGLFMAYQRLKQKAPPFMEPLPSSTTAE